MDPSQERLDLLVEYALAVPRDPVRVINTDPLSLSCPLDNGRLASPAVHGQLGTLNQFPMETILNIVHKMDIPSLMRFRSVNSTAMGAVDSLSEYKTIYRLVPDFLRVAIQTKASFFSLEKLYNTLCASKCASCGHFGGYIYMITCERVCLRCFTQKMAFVPLSLGAAAFAAGSSPEEVQANVPWMAPAPNRYGWGASGVYQDEPVLVDRRELEKWARRDTPSSSVPLASNLWSGGRDSWSCMAIMKAPTIGNGVVEWGVWCGRCHSDDDEDTHRDRQYSEDNLIDHIHQHHQ